MPRFMPHPQGMDMPHQTSTATARDVTRPESPQPLSIPLPLSPQITLHVQIKPLETSNLIFITTTDISKNPSISALGSFVYSMPNVCLSICPSKPNLQHLRPVQRSQPAEPFCTPLHTVSGSIDFATRVAKILAKRTGKPTHVGCSVTLGSSSVEEEAAALGETIDVIMGVLEEKA